MTDEISDLADALGSITRGKPVTPSDTQRLPLPSRALSVNTSGIVRVLTTGGDMLDIYIAAGVPFPICAQRVFATGTTAGGINALV